MLNLLKRIYIKAAITMTLAMAFWSAPASAEVILQAFNMRWIDVEGRLSEFKERGYTHIQISPPQKSHPETFWWARYQPIDHTVIDGPLGNETQFSHMIEAAHEKGLKIIVDFVFNQMACWGDYHRTLVYPHFKPENFHPRKPISSVWDERDGWLGGNGDLPDLRTESPYVRQQAKNYASKLLSLGVDGFRFDAAKHIEPEFFKELMTVIPEDKLTYAEVISGNLGHAFQYTPYVDVTDFELLRTMVSAFEYGNDLRILRSPSLHGAALPGPSAVTFARNHDTVMDPKSFPAFVFSDYQNALLANAYILAREEGLPFIFIDDADKSLVQAGVFFHENMLRQPEFYRTGNEFFPNSDNANLLFIERGNKGLAIINKGNQPFDIPSAKIAGLAAGCYKDLHYGFTAAVEERQGGRFITRWGTWNRGGMAIGPRDALFLVSTKWQECL